MAWNCEDESASGHMYRGGSTFNVQLLVVGSFKTCSNFKFVPRTWLVKTSTIIVVVVVGLKKWYSSNSVADTVSLALPDYLLLFYFLPISHQISALSAERSLNLKKSFLQCLWRCYPIQKKKVLGFTLQSVMKLQWRWSVNTRSSSTGTSA